MSKPRKLQERLAPTEHPTTLDIAWAAGIYEGEGSCYNSKGNASLCKVTQKDQWILHKLRALFGGAVTKQSKEGIYMWGVYGARARGFLMTIYSLLSPRRQTQVREANIFAKA